MKFLPILLLISILPLAGFASSKLKSKESFDNGRLSKVQCSRLGEDLFSKLQGLAISEGLPKDTFSVRTRMESRSVRPRHGVISCVSYFKSQNSNYGFLKDEGIDRRGADCKVQCQLDLQNLEAQSNNLGAETSEYRGFDFHLHCVVSSISLQKIL